MDGLYITSQEREWLLHVALGSGQYNSRMEHRYRHTKTGEIKTTLDVRVDGLPTEWKSEWRRVIETPWKTES